MSHSPVLSQSSIYFNHLIFSLRMIGLAKAKVWNTFVVEPFFFLSRYNSSSAKTSGPVGTSARPSITASLNMSTRLVFRYTVSILVFSSTCQTRMRNQCDLYMIFAVDTILVTFHGNALIPFLYQVLENQKAINHYPRKILKSDSH